MNRLFCLAACGFLAFAIVLACTFKIEPVVNVNDATVQVGPIYVCVDAGG